MRPGISCQTSPVPPGLRYGAATGTGSLGQRQLAFAKAILDPDRPVPPGLIGPDGEPSAKRFAVYRNNVVTGLVETLKAAFPAVRRIVGDAFFSGMARIYVAREPPNSPIMLDYGAGFADFVGAFEPAASLPYLRDVARLERAWVEAYHAADSAPLDLAAFGRIDPAEVPFISLALHPSLRILRSSFPAATIWQMNVEGGVPAAVRIEDGGEDILVARPLAEIAVRVLPAGAAAFIQALAEGAAIGKATTSALADDPRFDLAATLAGLLTAQAIVGWRLSENRLHDISGEPHEHG